MHRLYIMAHQRVLRYLQIPSEANLEVLKKALLDKNVGKYGAQVFHVLPRDQLRSFLKTPCPVENVETQQDVIKRGKRLRKGVAIEEKHVCGKCPFQSECRFANIQLHQHQLQGQNAVQDLLAHNETISQLLKPERVHYRVWTSGYKIMDGFMALMQDLSKGATNTQQFLKVRESHVKQITDQENSSTHQNNTANEQIPTSKKNKFKKQRSNIEDQKQQFRKIEPEKLKQLLNQASPQWPQGQKRYSKGGVRRNPQLSNREDVGEQSWQSKDRGFSKDRGNKEKMSSKVHNDMATNNPYKLKWNGGDEQQIQAMVQKHTHNKYPRTTNERPPKSRQFVPEKTFDRESRYNDKPRQFRNEDSSQRSPYRSSRTQEVNRYERRQQNPRRDQGYRKEWSPRRDQDSRREWSPRRDQTHRRDQNPRREQQSSKYDKDSSRRQFKEQTRPYRPQESNRFEQRHQSSRRGDQPSKYNKTPGHQSFQKEISREPERRGRRIKN